MDDTAWQDRTEFRALYPIIRWMDEPHAMQVCAEVKRATDYLALLIQWQRNPQLIRLLASQMDIATLAREHSFLVHLVAAFEHSQGPLAQACVPSAESGRDALASEGLRRGLSLHQGHTPKEAALAHCVALELSYPYEVEIDPDGGGVYAHV